MGRYVQSQIGPGEHVVYEAKVHWIAYASALEAASGVLVFLIMAARNEPPWSNLCYLLAFGCVLAAAAFGARAYLAIRFTELVITNKRVIAKFGLLARSTDEQPLSKIERCTFDQSAIGLALGFGDVAVQGIGGHSIPFRNIAEPVRFKEQVLAAIPHPETAPAVVP